MILQFQHFYENFEPLNEHYFAENSELKKQFYEKMATIGDCNFRLETPQILALKSKTSSFSSFLSQKNKNFWRDLGERPSGGLAFEFCFYRNVENEVDISFDVIFSVVVINCDFSSAWDAAWDNFEKF